MNQARMHKSHPAHRSSLSSTAAIFTDLFNETACAKLPLRLGFNLQVSETTSPCTSPSTSPSTLTPNAHQGYQRARQHQRTS